MNESTALLAKEILTESKQAFSSDILGFEVEKSEISSSHRLRVLFKDENNVDLDEIRKEIEGVLEKNGEILNFDTQRDVKFLQLEHGAFF